MFSERSGGAIALHSLCHHLNKNGFKSYVYHKRDYKKAISVGSHILLGFINYKGRHFADKRFLRNGLSRALGYVYYSSFKSFLTPRYFGKVDKNHIVIYPELVDDNPLEATNIVRWFLHKPGFHTGRVKYGKNELYFYYQKSFDDEKLNPHKDNLLRLTYVRSDIFYNWNLTQRKGSCYAVRKGKGKPIQHDLNNSILIDNLSLKKIAEVFNKTKIFYSYDTKTSYSRYAVMCGCKSVVIPDEGLSAEEWQPEEPMRYGIAYGIDDMEYAEKTSHLVLDNMRQMEVDNDVMVNFFVKKCEEYFG